MDHDSGKTSVHLTPTSRHQNHFLTFKHKLKSKTRTIDASFLITCLAVFILRFIPIAGELLVFIALSTYSFKSPRAALQSLFLTQVLVLLNPELVENTVITSIGRFATLIAAALSACRALIISSNKNEILTSFFIATLVLSSYLILHSLFFSPLPDVSLLKAIAWSLAMITSIVAWSILSPEQRTQTSVDIFTGISLVIVASAPFNFSYIGYARNGTGFQGILNQPQVFGITAASLFAYVLTNLLQQKRFSVTIALALALSGVCIVLSKARVAFLSPIIGVSLAMAVQVISKRRSSKLQGLRSPFFWTLIVILSAVGAFRYEEVGTFISDFVTNKRGGGASSLSEAYRQARGGAIDRMMVNIQDEPWTGIGFGISSISPSSMTITREPIFGLAVNAPVEKGILPLAVLEEVGVIGFMIFAMWAFFAFLSAIANDDGRLSVLFTIFLINLAESTLFSPGGAGLLFIVLLGWCTLPNIHLRQGVTLPKGWTHLRTSSQNSLYTPR